MGNEIGGWWKKEGDLTQRTEGSARSPLRGMSEVAVLGYLKAAATQARTNREGGASSPYKKAAAEFLVRAEAGASGDAAHVVAAFAASFAACRIV